MTTTEILLFGLLLILQIVLTTLRLRNKIKIPIWVTFLLSLTAGLVISIYWSKTLRNIYYDPEPHCGYPTGLITFVFGALWTVFSTSIVGLIGGLQYRDKQRQLKLSNDKAE